MVIQLTFSILKFSCIETIFGAYNFLVKGLTIYSVLFFSFCKKTFDFEAISSFYFVSVCIFFMLESCFTHSYLIFICIFIFGWFLFLRSWLTWMVYPKVHFLHIILCLVMIHLWHLDLWPSLTWMQICQVRLFLVGYISTLSPLHLVIDITQCNN